MKSRYKKEMTSISKTSSILIFSKTNNLALGDELTSLEGIEANNIVGLTFYADNYPTKERYDYIWADFCMSLDNNLLTKGNYIYLLKRTNKDTYKVVMLEKANKWREAYWLKEDPNNERDWSYIDEDIYELYNHLQDQYVDSLNNKHFKRFNKINLSERF